MLFRRSLIFIVIAIWAILASHACAAEKSEADIATAALFDTVTTTVINSFMDGLTWSAGYLKSFDGDKQGAMAMASRTVYNAQIYKYNIPISADLFGTTGHDNMIGVGFSADLSRFIKVKAGVGYAAGGYGWSWSISPINLSF